MRTSEPLSALVRTGASFDLPAPGVLVAQRYRVLRPLGEGGMGTVFEAENVLTQKRAALKWLHPRLLGRAAGQERLLREARATARIRHRNVLVLYDVLQEQSAVILVMELLTGELLSQHLKRTQLSFARLVRLLLPAMEGVAAAHAVGVLHRDIKPENIFLSSAHGQTGPVPKVIDFGISKIVTFEPGSLTSSGVALGTPRYVSFEQLRGERDVDARTDVYSFGVILYEALLGRAPYVAESMGEQAVQFVTTEPPRPRQLRAEIPEALSALVSHAIERDRARRFPSLHALIDALRPFADEGAYLRPLRVGFEGAALPEGAASPSMSTRPCSFGPQEAPVVEAARTLRPAAGRGGSRRLAIALAVCTAAAPALWLLHVRGASSETSKKAAPQASQTSASATAAASASISQQPRARSASLGDDPPRPALSTPPKSAQPSSPPLAPATALSSQRRHRTARAAAATSPRVVVADEPRGVPQTLPSVTSQSGAASELGPARAGRVTRDEF